jgi:hypothetical protein
MIKIKQKLELENIKLHIIVVEQDKQPTVNNKLPIEVEYIWVKNDGFYNRGWAFNIGFREFNNCNYFFFADNDIIMRDVDIINIFKTCDSYGAVNLYSDIWNTTDLSKHRIKKLIEKFNIDTDEKKDIIKPIAKYLEPQKRPNTCFSGGVMGISHAAMVIINGWDERFRGRGYEDYAFTAKLHLLIPSLHEYTYVAIHIYHPWETNTTREINTSLDREYQEHSFDDYVIHIISTYDKIGLKKKYEEHSLSQIVINPSSIKYLPQHQLQTYLISRLCYYESVSQYVKSWHHKCDQKCIKKIIYLFLAGLHICTKECAPCCCKDINSVES